MADSRSPTEPTGEAGLTEPAEILASFGLEPQAWGPWLGCGTSDRSGGWKLHLSSIEVDAEALLRSVVPLLVRRRIAFKCARDLVTLSGLNAGERGPGLIGKFMTVYPRDNRQARRTALSLEACTRGLRGPVILTDIRLGDVLYARFGSIAPRIVRSRLGQHVPMIRVGGGYRPDAYAAPYVPPADIPNPFEDLQRSSPPSGPDASRSPFGPGYLLTQVRSVNAKGFVFLALDVRRVESLGLRIVKQGRQHCYSDRFGRDIRTRLRSQRNLHAELQGRAPVPRAHEYFEVDGDGYLPLDHMDGVSLEAYAHAILDGVEWSRVGPTVRARSLGVLARVIDAARRMHRAGVAHRDLSASNVLVTPKERVVLLDLELAHRLDDPRPHFGLGTPGFMSPQQFGGGAPCPEDDVFAVGGLSFLMLSGMDPQRLLFVEPSRRVETVRYLTGGAPRRYLRLPLACLEDRPEHRPSLDKLHDHVTRWRRAVKGRGTSTRRLVAASTWGPGIPDEALGPSLRGAILALLRHTPRDGDSGMWLSPPFEDESSGGGPQQGEMELRRSANRGVAGVVYALARLRRLGARWQRQAVEEHIRSAVRWLLGNHPAPDGGMPGLHFGEAGVALAISEAVAAGIVKRTRRVDAFLGRSLAGTLDWPDVTHGAAGQGIAAFACADLLGSPRLATHADRCADHLCEHQQEDGSWRMPDGAPGMSGEILTGFAHGVAGMVYFLAEHARRTSSEASHEAWQRGARWLTDAAAPARTGRGLEWAYSDQSQDRWAWWCHGGPGIALTYLRLFEFTGEASWARSAERALSVPALPRGYPNLSQCHGLSGLGDIFVEAARVLGKDVWLRRAKALASRVHHARRQFPDGACLWQTETIGITPADLMGGIAGVALFFMKLRRRGRGMGCPLLLDPVAADD